MTARAEFRKKTKIKRSGGDITISVITYFIYALFAFVCVYPFYYLIINSISANNLSERGKVLFYPMEIHFKNYENLGQIPGLTDAALMSVYRTVAGTALTVIIAAFLGYIPCGSGNSGTGSWLSPCTSTRVSFRGTWP